MRTKSGQISLSVTYFTIESSTRRGVTTQRNMLPPLSRRARMSVHYTDLCRKRDWRGRLWLAAAGQKLFLNLAPFLLLNPVLHSRVVRRNFPQLKRNRIKRAHVREVGRTDICAEANKRACYGLSSFSLRLCAFSVNRQKAIRGLKYGFITSRRRPPCRTYGYHVI